MKFWAILFLLAIAGCNQQQQSQTSSCPPVPSRNQFSVGMTSMDVWKLYGVDIHDVNTVSCIPHYPLVSETQDGTCSYKTYRYWLRNNRKMPDPYYLTFHECPLPEADEIRERRQQGIAYLHALYETDPNLKKEVDAFCTENKLSPENKDTVEELLLYRLDPNYIVFSKKVESKLVEIKLDEQTIWNQKFADNQERMRQQQSSYQQQAARQRDEMLWRQQQIQFNQEMQRQQDFMYQNR